MADDAALTRPIRFAIKLTPPQRKSPTSNGDRHDAHLRQLPLRRYRIRNHRTAAQFRWLKGEHLIKYYESPRGYQRGFCSDCGSPIINRAGPNWPAPAAFPDTIPQYGIALALLDDPPARPECHVFVGSKAPWFEITDDLPRHAEYPPPA
jgi:hypothetical protein